MAKIENDVEKSSTPARRRYRVQVSFNGLNQGDEFTADGGSGSEAWEAYFVEVGYLRDLGEEGPDVRSAEGTR